MIFETLAILSEEVDAYLGGDVIVIENVTSVDLTEGRGTLVANKVILSLLNIQEESTMKNFPNVSVKGDRMLYKNPIVNLNLFLLFSANRSTYTQSLSDLSKVIEFFQGKKQFTQSNTIFKREVSPLNNVGNFKFSVELYTPTFEELNFIWGTLGGKQLPSALYKVSVIEVEQGNIISESGAIAESTGATGRM